MTQQLCSTAGRVIGIDIQRKLNLNNSSAHNKTHYRTDNGSHSGLEFHLTSAWDLHNLWQICDGFTVICLDLAVILGADLMIDGTALIKSLERMYQNSLRVVVVKSRALSHHAKHCINVQSMVDQGTTLTQMICK